MYLYINKPFYNFNVIMSSTLTLILIEKLIFKLYIKKKIKTCISDYLV